MKNIVIFSDGTCNETDEGYPTNVLKLYKMIERRSKRQVAFYDPGVGTGIYKITGAAFGVGISKNIQECYEFLIDYYEPGDKIYLFGFSRGAYTARSLGGMIKKSGILRRHFRKLSDKAFEIYKKRDNERVARVFKATHCWPTTVETHHDVYFIGVWDTVSALGFPLAAIHTLNPFSQRLYGFHDAKLSEHVKFGYQALAIDDKRKIFKPEIWDEHSVDEQTIEQVWFAGVHSNIGGGYRRSGLSDISLEWMAEKAKGAGLHFWPETRKPVLMSPDSDGKIYDPRSGFGKIYTKADRVIPAGSRIHKSVFERLANEDSLYKPNNLPDSYLMCDNGGAVGQDEETTPK